MKLKILLGLFLVFMVVNEARAGLNVDFTFKDLDGNTYSPETFAGQPVVIYIGSTF